MTRVKNLGHGILADETGRRYVADCDGEGHAMDEETGEIFDVVREDDGGIWIV